MKKIFILLFMAITVQLTAQPPFGQPVTHTQVVVGPANVPICNCGRWTAQNVIISSKPLNFNTVCGGTITLPIAAKYHILVPIYNCSQPPPKCVTTYNWDVQGPGSVDGNGTGRPFDFNFSASGTYAVTITPRCGNINCPPCSFKVIIP